MSFPGDSVVKNMILYAIVSTYLWGIDSNTRSGYLKPQMVTSPISIYTMLFPIHSSYDFNSQIRHNKRLTKTSNIKIK